MVSDPHTPIKIINKFNRISGCISVKEIWDKLEVTYEGTNQEKETRINMLVHKYELFQMEQNKIISSVFIHFTDIISGLKCLGKTYTNSDLVRKVLRSLPRSWKLKATTIQEVKDLNTYPLDELMGSFMTHELSMQQRSDEESKKKKTITLKAIISAPNEEDLEKLENEEAEDDDMALLAHNFRKFLRKKGPPIRGKNSYRKSLDRVIEKEKEKDKKKEKNNVFYG